MDPRDGIVKDLLYEEKKSPSHTLESPDVLCFGNIYFYFLYFELLTFLLEKISALWTTKEDIIIFSEDTVCTALKFLPLLNFMTTKPPRLLITTHE